MLVTVIPHNARWKTLYENEAERLRAILGETLTAIHHIGGANLP